MHRHPVARFNRASDRGKADHNLLANYGCAGFGSYARIGPDSVAAEALHEFTAENIGCIPSSPS